MCNELGRDDRRYFFYFAQVSVLALVILLTVALHSVEKARDNLQEQLFEVKDSAARLMLPNKELKEADAQFKAYAEKACHAEFPGWREAGPGQEH
jgi:hypothetical protein